VNPATGARATAVSIEEVHQTVTQDGLLGLALHPELDFQRSGNATVAPGGLEIYTGTAIPGWDNSLLVLSLLRGAVFRVPLRADGRAVNGAPLAYFKSTNRYRDIALHPDGRRFYLVTDSEGRTTDDTGALTRTVANPGAVIEYTFTSSR